MPAKVKTTEVAKKPTAVKKAAVKVSRTPEEIKERRRHLPPQTKNNVKQIKHKIRVIKRNGGTMRFAKKLRTIRNTNDSKRKADRRITDRRIKNLKVKAAFKAVEGKKTKDGKPVRPVLKKQHAYEVKKMRKFYQTQLAPRTLPSKNFFKDMNTAARPKIAKLRRSLVPGTVCVLLAGKHKGHRVVFLKQLKRSGLCLVTGPMKLNKVPMRRMNQNYLVATSVKINMEGVKVPKHINDFYFKREKAPKNKKKANEEDIFEAKKKQKQGPSKERKKDQKVVDRQIVGSIKKSKDRSMVLRYLAAKFCVMGRRYPHTIKF